MKKIIKNKIFEIVNANVENSAITTDHGNLDLSEFGMGSIQFIQLIVSLEEEFECEIPDSKLLISEMNTVNKIYKVLTSIEGGDGSEVESNIGESDESSASK